MWLVSTTLQLYSPKVSPKPKFKILGLLIYLPRLDGCFSFWWHNSNMNSLVCVTVIRFRQKQYFHKTLTKLSGLAKGLFREQDMDIFAQGEVEPIFFAHIERHGWLASDRPEK